jgi:hypothetical protein
MAQPLIIRHPPKQSISAIMLRGFDALVRMLRQRSRLAATNKATKLRVIRQ